MSRVLVTYETDALGRAPTVARNIAQGAEEVGADVRMRPLTSTRLRDVQWADALALGIEGREVGLPHAAKHWLDTLGVAGWHAFHNKAGCVFATHPRDYYANAHSTCRILARLLSERGMDTSTPADLGMHGTMASGTLIGRRLGVGSQSPLAAAAADADLRRFGTR